MEPETASVTLLRREAFPTSVDVINEVSSNIPPTGCAGGERGAAMGGRGDPFENGHVGFCDANPMQPGAIQGSDCRV